MDSTGFHSERSSTICLIVTTRTSAVVAEAIQLLGQVISLRSPGSLTIRGTDSSPSVLNSRVVCFFRPTAIVIALSLWAVVLEQVTAGVSFPGGLQSIGSTYYVDSIQGKDQSAGMSPATAWKALAKVNSTTFAPGDRILFKSGDKWTGQLWPKG